MYIYNNNNKKEKIYNVHSLILFSTKYCAKNILITISLSTYIM